ncbi:MAG TPA: hypothetical protein VFN82_07630 [Solirubrobacterales bacterium]|jgi:hypothetical protein|nr:hypothetical protein [Solirubrobacterales bacterium]
MAGKCPRCGQASSGNGRRPAHCTACGAPLASAGSPSEADVRAYLYGSPRLRLRRPDPSPRGPATLH